MSGDFLLSAGHCGCHIAEFSNIFVLKSIEFNSEAVNLFAEHLDFLRLVFKFC